MDALLDFWEDHRKLCIVIIVVVVLVIAMFVVRAINMANKEPEDPGVADYVPTQQPGLDQDKVVESEPGSEYHNQLGHDADKWTDGRVQVTEKPEETPEPTPTRRTPRYPIAVEVFGNTVVPTRNQDGSSCKDYFSRVKLADFGTLWGTALTADDFKGNTRIYVGVAEKEYSPINNLESSGWLITHLDELQPNDVIQFTNLHVIGSLSSTHVALLCSYDWYSAFGMKDTLIVFEDMSGTLDTKDFHEGDIFSATVFVHNIKVMSNVQGQRVIVCQYATYDEDLYW